LRHLERVVDVAHGSFAHVREVVVPLHVRDVLVCVIDGVFPDIRAVIVLFEQDLAYVHGALDAPLLCRRGLFHYDVRSSDISRGLLDAQRGPHGRCLFHCDELQEVLLLMKKLSMRMLSLARSACSGVM
jgi:hypothetical protein